MNDFLYNTLPLICQGSPHIKRDTGLIRHAGLIPWRIEDHIHIDRLHAWNRAHGRLNPTGHLARDRAARGCERHIDLDMAVVVDCHI